MILRTAAVLTAAMLLFAQAAPAETRVVVGINILAQLVKGVGGDKVSVESLAAGAPDPHTFELKPSHLVSIAHADLVVALNPGFDAWAERLDDSSSGKVFWLASAGKSELDVHYWLDPLTLMEYAGALREKLCELAPENCLTFKSNFSSFAESLKNLNGEIERRTSAWKRKEFVADHPAWEAFAARYGLKQLAVLRESETRQIAAGEMARLLRNIKHADVKVFVVEESAGALPLEFLEEAGLKVAVLDSLGRSNESYNQLMLKNVGVLEPLMNE